MRAFIWLLISYFAAMSASAQQLGVSICNIGGVDRSLVTTAKTETESIFRSAGVEIAWIDCGETNVPIDQSIRKVFTIRLRTDITPRSTGSLSMKEMGRTFASDGSSGFLADAYLRSIRNIAEQYQADMGVLLGVVIAHELGHLILGAGHTEDGIMQGRWEGREIRAMEKRWLLFDKFQADAIHYFLIRPDSKMSMQESR